MHEQTTIAFDERYEIRINAFVPAANNHLFNEANFFRMHASSVNDFYAQLVRVSDTKVHATVAFYETDNGVFTSPKRGTFGGFGLNEPLSLQSVERFLTEIMDFLKSLKAHLIHVKCPPLSHDLALSSVVSNIFLRHGATICGHELNYDMRMDGRTFLQRIDYSNVKRIRKCLGAGFVAEKIPPANYADAYCVIQENRERHGYPISMTAAQLDLMTATFPGKVHYFAVFPDAEKSRIAAAAVCLTVSATVLYVFYWGDAPDMGTYSPIALLASCIYDFSQREGFAVLDAGTSTVLGEPNLGLINFKRNLGFSESLKLSVELQLES